MTRQVRFLALLAGALSLLLSSSQMEAQQTGTVFSPDVSEDDRSFEYRATYDPDDEGFAHRLHYQHALSDAWRLRAIVLQSGDDNESLEYRYARLEAQYQFFEDQEAGWDSALRFELQIADGDSDGPSRFRLAWSSKWALNDKWGARTNLLTGRQFGSDRGGGLLLEGRAQVTRKLNESFSVGVDWFGDLNRTTDMGSFDDQEHQLGPIVKFDITERLSGLAGALYGISDAAADLEFRLIVGFGL